MAQSKRKRNSTRTKPNKRLRYVDSSASEPNNQSDTLWAAECILDEQVFRGVRKYYIQWKGTDPDTGKAWAPTWEPEENANELLVADWEQEKARELAQVHEEFGGSNRRQSAQRQEAQTETSSRIRNSRVIDSSPEPAPRSSTPSIPLNNRVSSETLPSATASPARASPRIQIARRGDSLDRNNFVCFSSLPSPQPASIQGSTQDTNLDSSQLFAARPRPRSPGIVPDSQSSIGEGSFIPATQRTEDVSQQSTDTNESRVDEDDEDVEDSGLLELIEEAAQYAASPARSIPETIPDTTVADSQSQRQRLEAESQGAPNTLEVVHISSQSEQVSSQEREDSVHIHHSEDPPGVAQLEHQRENVCELEARQPGHTVAQTCPARSPRETISDREEDTSNDDPRGDRTSANTARNASTEFDGTAGIRPSLNKSFTLVDNSQSHRDTPVAVGSNELSQHQTPQQISVRDSQASPIEHSLSEENEQFPFQSQYPFPRPEPSDAKFPVARPQQLQQLCATPDQADVLAGVSAPSESIPAPTRDPPHRSVQTSPNHHQSHDLPVTSVESEVARSSSPSDQPQEVLTLREQLLHASSSPERVQNAQVVIVEADLSTQEDTFESIRPTIEEEGAHRASSESRHDSSQETPEQPSKSLDHDTSPVPYPPSYSLRTQKSRLPSRPCTPVLTSSLSIMAGESTSDIIRRQIAEAIAKRKAETPYTPSPRRRPNRSSMAPSVAGEGAAATPTPVSRLRGTNAEGTRSPSAVPDRSPLAQTPTSLRSIAHAPSAALPEASLVDKVMISPPVARPEPTTAEATTLSDPIVPTSPASDEMEVSDADDEDSESLLDDDLQLADQEFIVPLFIQGRQSDMYAQYITANKSLLEPFLKDRHSIESVEQVESIMSKLRGIETHMDLVFAEAEPKDLDGEASLTQAEHMARFGLENSAKFRFLQGLLDDLRHAEPRKHVVLVTERDDETLFRILETFCKAALISYTMPEKGRKANPQETVGSLLVTIIPNDASPIIHAPDLIICLDGVQDATQIRKKNWAKSPDGDVVPVIHLVIPRTVGHIERYVSSSLDPVERMHTVLASLAHVHPDIGKAIDERTPRDIQCALLVADWIKNRMEGADWPLPSIGSVKHIIEYQSQVSQTSTDTPVPERTKRPLDEEELDPAKRMRFTPQPQTASTPAVNKGHEVTHISDSMPGTAAHISDLQSQLTHVQKELQEARDAHRADRKRFDEHERMWEKQQTVHEDLASEHRIVKRKLQDEEAKNEALTKNVGTLNERLLSRTTELRKAEEQLKEQRQTDLLSQDARIVEITKLRKEVDETRAERDKAVATAATAEKTLDYMRGVYQDAQNKASTLNAHVEELTAEKSVLTKAASGEAAKRKSMHIGKSYDEQQKRIARLEAELSIAKRTIVMKEEENLRLKSAGRPGVGTRGTSATPQPKTRSRAASPTYTGGSRIANLRNG